MPVRGQPCQASPGLPRHDLRSRAQGHVGRTEDGRKFSEFSVLVAPRPKLVLCLLQVLSPTERVAQHVNDVMVFRGMVFFARFQADKCTGLDRLIAVRLDNHGDVPNEILGLLDPIGAGSLPVVPLKGTVQPCPRRIFSSRSPVFWGSAFIREPALNLYRSVFFVMCYLMQP